MKKLFKHILILALPCIFLNQFTVVSQNIQESVQKCAMNAGPDATYLKDFVVKLDGIRPDERPPVFRATLVLRKNVSYRFSLCNLDTSEGEAIIRLYDEANMLASTYYPETGKEYKSINFSCQKSGVYTIMISFKDGKAGEAIGIMSYVSK